MAARITTLSLARAPADRARMLANLHGVPVGSYLADLIDRAYTQSIGALPSAVTVDGDAITVALGDERLTITKAYAGEFAAKLGEIATKGGNAFDVEHPASIFIGRKGNAVRIEWNAGRSIKQLISATDARRLAAEIEASLHQ